MDILNKHVNYINLNNIFVKSHNKKYSPEKILVLLPHCLQNSECNIKITYRIENCRKCFRCPIGYIKEITDKNNLSSVIVAAGGSFARDIVHNNNPDLIIAVACERELANGIEDMKDIPVIGILNKRPNGPCINTGLDIDEFKHVLENVLG